MGKNLQSPLSRYDTCLERRRAARHETFCSVVLPTFRCCCGGQVLRRYLVQNRDDYVKYNKIVGLITKLTARLKVCNHSVSFTAIRPVGGHHLHSLVLPVCPFLFYLL